MAEGSEAEVCAIVARVCMERLFRNSSFQVGVDVVAVDVGGGEEEEEGCSTISFQVMVTGSVLTRGENWLLCMLLCVRW